MKIVYLGLGSNLGDRTENITFALSLLQSSSFICIEKISSFYETSPVGPKQRSFYNVAVKARTVLNPSDLLLFVKQVERISGRKKTIKWGPRVVDIDILFFDQTVIDIGVISDRKHYLVIPHKEIQNRLFVLIPLCEIAGNFVHPVLKQKISNILQDKSLTLKRQKVRIIAEPYNGKA